jgi:DNA repair protein RecN (Recombination protein N)
MLKNLHISNYALISELDIDFKNGLTIITGETGAGKSILLGALALLAGKRADTDVLSDKDTKCIVEGEFFIKNYNLQTFFDENDMEYEDLSIIRREIKPNGKSRAFVNDSPVNVGSLKQLGEKLIDIHSQHDTLILKDKNFHLSILDTFADHDALLNEFAQNFAEFKKLEKQYEKIKSDIDQAGKEYEYYKFQFDELEKAQLKEGELSGTEHEYSVLENSENIKSVLSSAYNKLSGEENDIISGLSVHARDLEGISGVFSEIGEVSSRMNSVIIELKDIADEILKFDEGISMDPERFNYLANRINLLNSLMQKHNAADENELIKIRDEYKEKVNSVENSDVTIEELKKSLDSAGQQTYKLAGRMTENRKNVVPEIEKHIQQKLSKLGMPKSVFRIKHHKLEGLGSTGQDDFEFLFSANGEQRLLLLNKVASGGELSRFMLSLKSTISGKMNLPTIIFDEIDTGVSGEIAFKMGEEIKQLSGNLQVVNITHLPQIAGKGDHHFKVYKEQVNGKVNTGIRLLSKDERRTEIARMLSGEKITEAALSNADELLSGD